MQNDIHRSDLIKDKHFWPSSLPSGFSCQRSEARFSHSIAAQPWLRFLRKLLTFEKKPWKSTEQSHEDGRGNTAGEGNVIEIGIVNSARTRREKTLKWKDTRSWKKKKKAGARKQQVTNTENEPAPTDNSLCPIPTWLTSAWAARIVWVPSWRWWAYKT